MGIIALIFTVIVLIELGIFNILLHRPHVVEDKNKVAAFFSSIWPGFLLFISIGSVVTSTLYWWFEV
jgi:hypothetical protein